MSENKKSSNTKMLSEVAEKVARTARDASSSLVGFAIAFGMQLLLTDRQQAEYASGAEEAARRARRARDWRVLSETERGEYFVRLALQAFDALPWDVINTGISTEAYRAEFERELRRGQLPLLHHEWALTLSARHAYAGERLAVLLLLIGSAFDRARLPSTLRIRFHEASRERMAQLAQVWCIEIEDEIERALGADGGAS